MATLEELIADRNNRQAPNLRRQDGEDVVTYRQRLVAAQQAGGAQESPLSALMNAKAEDEMTSPPRPETNVFAQGMNGVNEGIASLAGLPVDMATAATNLGTRGINAAIGTDIPQIEQPVFGAGMFQDAMRNTGAITPDDPQNMGQRFARSIGQEAGASIIPGAAALGKAQRTAGTVGRFLGLEAASSVGAGIGAQATAEALPENTTAQTLAALIGGGAPIAAARIATPGASAPSIDDLRDQQRAAYRRVEESKARLSPDSAAAIRGLIQRRVADEGVSEFLPQPVRSISSRAEALPDDAMITDVEDLRRIVGNDVAGNADPQTRRIGVDLKNGIDNYLNGLTPNDVQAGNPQAVMADLSEGRELTQRIARSEGLTGDTGAVTRAERRAASTGTGGNEVNAIRQNIRRILDQPRLRRQYSDEQIAAMTDIVEGTPTANALRLIGRMSPTSGALPMMANIGAASTAGATGNLLFGLPGALGLAAQSGAEALTQYQVRQLDQMVRNGAPLDPSRMTEPQRAALAGLLTAQTENAVSGLAP